MGQQQILLIVLSVILVGIAIAVGITMFTAQAEQSAVDNLINDLNNLGAQAYQFYIRPVSMSGGGNSWTGGIGVLPHLRSLPGWDRGTYTAATNTWEDSDTGDYIRNEVGYYAFTIGAQNVLEIVGTSAAYPEQERTFYITAQGEMSFTDPRTS